MKYDAVIFDLFGTLVDTYTIEMYDDMLRRMAEALGLPFGPFREAWMRTFRERIVGEFRTTRECIEVVCARIGVDPDSGRVERAVGIRNEVTRSMLVPRPDVLDTLDRLRGMDLRLGLISDCSCEVPPLWEGTPMAPRFDAAVFSCLFRNRKPHPEIYRECCRRLGVRPEGCLYVGDGSSRELTGAVRVGMTPVLIRVPYDTYGWHRPDAEEWTGPVISTISGVLRFLG